jgi:hypothetical protein
MQSIAQRLRVLAEEGGQSVPKYVDRELIDYWRTVQGTPVGFHGKVPGEGVPIAGPPVLTGGSGTDNPLLKPLLKKYPKGTYTGDAIRKPNFPLSLTVFFDNVLGDDAAIKKRMGELESLYDTHSEKFGANGVQVLQKVLFKNDYNKLDALKLLKSNYEFPQMQMSYVSAFMNSLGVSGTLSSKDYAYGDNEIDEALMKLGTNPEALKEVIRDTYLMNQVLVRRSNKTGFETVTRGMGDTIPGLDGDSSLQFIENAKKNGVSVRIVGQRAASPTASGVRTRASFGPIGFQAIPIPIEAALSSFDGLRLQENEYASERETTMLGLADLAIDPMFLSSYVSSSSMGDEINDAAAKWLSGKVAKTQ